MNNAPAQLKATDELSPVEASGLSAFSATEYLTQFHKGAVTALEMAEACITRVQRFDNNIKAFHRFDPELLRERASRIDREWPENRQKWRAPGVLLGVKDVFNTYDYPTGMGSPILDHYTPGNDARVVSNWRLDGGLVAGKTVTAEFAVHHPGPTVNPHAFDRTPGTSSSGSAAAVASYMVPVALATQTAGSIIRPASYCGVIGFKPSFGLLPRTAMLKTTDSLDTVGLIARTIDDAELVFEITRVRGWNYPVSEAALTDPARQMVKDRPWRVGVLEGPKKSYEAEKPARQLDDIAKALAAAGVELVRYQLPESFAHAHELHSQIYHKALAYYFKREWEMRPDMFSQVLAEMIAEGMDIAPESYHAAVKQQNLMARDFDHDMANLDVVIGLATADEAPVGLLSRDLPDHCLLWTMCGAPSMSLPLLRGTHGFPVGLQVVARKYSDYKLMAFTRLLAKVVGAKL